MPRDASSVESMTDSLVRAAQDSHLYLDVPPTSASEVANIRDEVQKFSEFIRSLTEEQIASAEPLPYRRTLSKGESNHLLAKLRDRWQVDGKGYWHPLTARAMPPHVVAFHVRYFDERKRALLRKVARRLGATRVLEKREYKGFASEFDLELFEPVHDGREGYWTSESVDWLVYASHEASLTIAGEAFLDNFRALAPNCDEHLWN